MVHTIFSQFIFRKIITVVATTYHILRLKCTKFYFGWALPQTLLEELTALPRSLAGFKGPTSENRGGGSEKEEEGIAGKWWKGKGKEGEGEKRL